MRARIVVVCLYALTLVSLFTYVPWIGVSDDGMGHRDPFFFGFGWLWHRPSMYAQLEWPVVFSLAAIITGVFIFLYSCVFLVTTHTKASS